MTSSFILDRIAPLILLTFSLSLTLACGKDGFSVNMGNEYQLHKSINQGSSITFNGANVVQRWNLETNEENYGPLIMLNWNNEFVFFKHAEARSKFKSSNSPKRYYFYIDKKDHLVQGPFDRDMFKNILQQKSIEEMNWLYLHEARVKSHQEFPDQGDIKKYKEHKNFYGMLYAFFAFLWMLPTGLIALFLSRYATKRKKNWPVFKIWILSLVLIPLITYFYVYHHYQY